MTQEADVSERLRFAGQMPNGLMPQADEWWLRWNLKSGFRCVVQMSAMASELANYPRIVHNLKCMLIGREHTAGVENVTSLNVICGADMHAIAYRGPWILSGDAVLN